MKHLFIMVAWVALAFLIISLGREFYDRGGYGDYLVAAVMTIPLLICAEMFRRAFNSWRQRDKETK